MQEYCGGAEVTQNEPAELAFIAQAAWLRSCNGTPPACF